MALSSKIENAIVSLKAQTGTMANGKPRYKSYSYSNISVNATDADLHFVAKRLSTLFNPNIAKITRQNIVDLFEEI